MTAGDFVEWTIFIVENAVAFAAVVYYLHFFNKFSGPAGKKGLTGQGKVCILLLPFCNLLAPICLSHKKR